jgi:AcrR family transcriptional regulator
MLSNQERVDPRTRRTQALLQDAFVQLLGEKSFEALTVQDITARATVNRATFYAHFADKYALLDAIIAAGFAQSLQRRLDAPADSVAAYLRQLLLAVTDHLTAISTSCQRSLHTYEAVVEAQIKAQLQTQLRGWLAGQPAMRRQPAQRLDVVATLLSWSLYGAVTEWRKQGGQRSTEAFADEVVPLLAATIGAVSQSA